MAVDQHAIASFYRNAKYEHVLWTPNGLNRLQDRRKIVCWAVFHVATPGDNPGVIKFIGDEFICARLNKDGLIVRIINQPPSKIAKESFFSTDGTIQDLSVEMDDPINLAAGGMEVAAYRSALGPVFDDLVARAEVKILELRLASAPGVGTY